MMKEIREEIEEGEMPPWLFRFVEPDSRLSNNDRSLLRNRALGQDLKNLDVAVADHNRKEKKSRYQKRYRNDSKHYGKRYLTPVNNPTFKEECGACHLAYQPELLPSGSWGKILSGLEDHFGEVIMLDPQSRKAIAEYLRTNAAEHSSAKRAVKIMKCLGNLTPLRITKIPYIQRKHHEVLPKVLNRDSIGSLSNCSACHTTAEKGIYDDDYVVIPP